MTRLLRYSFFVLLFLVYCHAKAATGNISGRVTNSSGQPLSFASVTLLQSDSTLVKTELTNEKGDYQLTLLSDGNYLLKVVLSGYEQYSSSIIQVAGTAVNMPDIVLALKENQLKEVSVRGQKPFIEVKADKIVVNVENSIVNAGSSVFEALSRSPGVKIDQNDAISLKGKQGVNVMINGKIQPMSNEDLANMLKSMPASSVESIELISNPSAKYDAAGTAGIINIKTKKDKKIGLYGSINASYAQGVYGKGNTGFNINYRNKKFNFYANANLSNRKGFSTLNITRDFYKNGVFASGYDQVDNYIYHFGTYLGGIGMDYNLTSKTIIGFAMNTETNYLGRDAKNYSTVIDSATHQPVSKFFTLNASPNYWHSYTANVNVRHTIDSAGRSLSFDADYAIYPSNGSQNYTTTFYNINADGTVVPSMQPDILIKGNLEGATLIRSLKLDYSHPLKNNANFEAGAKSSFVTADNSISFYQLHNGNYELDPGKTDHFIYNENINAAYVNYTREFKKWGTQLGLRTEQTIANGNDVTIDSAFHKNYVKLFPSLAAQRHINANNDLGLTLSRRIERPNYEQLNPFKYYLDQTSYKTGFPYLNPALSYSIELSHSYKQKIITTLTYSYTSQPLVEVLQPSTTEDKITIQSTKNLINMSFYGVGGSYQFQIKKWWANTTNFNAYYAHYEGDVAGSNLSTGKATFDVYSSNSFLLPKNYSAELSMFYQAPQVYGYMNLKPQSMVSFGLQKNLFDKKVTVKLNITDIFWRGYPVASSIYNNFEEHFIAKRDTRQASLTAIYRFGKRTIQPIQKHDGGAEDEKKRVGGKGNG